MSFSAFDSKNFYLFQELTFTFTNGILSVTSLLLLKFELWVLLQHCL